MGVRFPPGAPTHASRARTHSQCQRAGTRICDDTAMKQCTGCGIQKSSEDFFFKNIAKGRRHARCKTCQQRYYREYYHRTPHLIRWQVARTRRYRIRNRAHVDEYLRRHSCVDCGLADPLVLEFDHVIGIKRASVSTLARQALPIETIDAEIRKCEVRCANCHRRRTALSWPLRTRIAKGMKEFSADTTDNDGRQPR
jgi:hypothetical protein